LECHEKGGGAGLKIYVREGASFVWQWQPKEQIVLDGYPEGVYDTDCEVLAELGVHYMTQEEFDAIFEGLLGEEVSV
jgi:hypothetical protein